MSRKQKCFRLIRVKRKKILKNSFAFFMQIYNFQLTFLFEPEQFAPYNFRLKSFLTAFGRVKISEVAQVDLDAVVRIQCDGIVFNKDIELEFESLVRDPKTTGNIFWKNVNSYSNLL